MEYQYVNVSGYPIYLYTTPLSSQSKILPHFKTPVDVISHWAICIQGQCYELKKNNDKNKSKTDPKYVIRSLPEQEWKDMKRVKENNRPYHKVPEPIGYTSRPFSIETIKYIGGRVWDKPLQSKYVHDENNCQVFIRLLVDLIGSKQTQAEFPGTFDKYVKRAGGTRDFVFLFGATAATLAAATVDPSGVAAAGFFMGAAQVVRSSTALWTDRYAKEKFIRKAQEELREELKRAGVLPY